MAPYLESTSQGGHPPHTPPEEIRVHCGGIHTHSVGDSPVGGSPVGGSPIGGSPVGGSPVGGSPGGVSPSSSLSPSSTPPAPSPSPPPATQEAQQNGTPCQVVHGQSTGGEVMYFTYPPPGHYPYPPVGFLQYPGGLPPGIQYHPAHYCQVSPHPQSQGMPQCQVVYSQGYPVHNTMPSENLSSQHNPNVPPLQSPGYHVTVPQPQSIPHCQVVYSPNYPESVSSPVLQDPSVLEVGPSSSPPVSQTTSGGVSPVSEPSYIPPPASTPHTEPPHHLQPPSDPYPTYPDVQHPSAMVAPLMMAPTHPPTYPDLQHPSAMVPPSMVPSSHPPTYPDQHPSAMVPPPMVSPTHPGHAAMVYAASTASQQQAYMGYSGPGGGEMPMYSMAAMSPMGPTGGDGTCVQVMSPYPVPAPAQANTAAVQYPPPGHPGGPAAPPSSMAMSPTAEGVKWRDAVPTISKNMELVWHGEFNSRFLTFGPHRWFLIPVEKPPGETAATLWPSDLYLPTVPWRTFRDSAKVRFCCDSCGNGWTSMKGRVIFWFYQDPKDLQGYVLFKLYGQQCKRCANGQFEHAMWYPDEVVKVIENLYHRVGQVYYSFFRPPIRIERRSGKPREQHNSELCQACKEGLCQEELMFT